ncbi:hypothetical protein Dret_2505 (plasmid) [Desulfohalobium retbaense DSM 5692]|uniref:Uncharacterized protein n=1 Tax=Desulfohalobium retbaense (strain ATCC 49708 / DSM 5692 / JCM 16813 / HR100) TaxID=485915 RepID=C8X5T9_DESRD|nr:hypothetical protein Dret_2505 [Desulfohalobium retbaense DSM 5692]
MDKTALNLRVVIFERSNRTKERPNDPGSEFKPNAWPGPFRSPASHSPCSKDGSERSLSSRKTRPGSDPSDSRAACKMTLYSGLSSNSGKSSRQGTESLVSTYPSRQLPRTIQSTLKLLTGRDFKPYTPLRFAT